MLANQVLLSRLIFGFDFFCICLQRIDTSNAIWILSELASGFLNMLYPAFCVTNRKLREGIFIEASGIHLRRINHAYWILLVGIVKDSPSF
jgi:hypothetical protein